MKHLIYLSAFVLLISTACKKESKSNGETPQVEKQKCRISKVIQSKQVDGKVFGSEYNYTYDPTDNISGISIKYQDDKHVLKSSQYAFAYRADTITESTNLYIKNTGGQIVKNDIDPESQSFEAFEYNAEGYLKKAIYHIGNSPIGVFDFKYTNGNLTQIIYTGTHNGGGFTSDISYTDKPRLAGMDVALDSWLVDQLSAKLNNTLFPLYLNTATGVFGKNSKNLVRSIKYADAEDSSYNSEMLYSYTFDEKNKPVKIVVNDNFDESTTTLDLTYECK